MNDSWITSYEDFVNGSSRAPRLAHVLQSPSAAIPVSALSFANGNDQPTWSYAFALAPGHTAVIWNFAAGLANAPGRDAEGGAAYRASAGHHGLHEQRRARGAVELRARAYVPSGPEPTGPGSMQITLPTTADNYAASTPFISLGGLAGPARLNRVVWSSNRGPSGIAQGLVGLGDPLGCAPSRQQRLHRDRGIRGAAAASDTINVNLATTTYLVPEGSTGTFFSTDLLIANPTDATVEANVQLLTEENGAIALATQVLPPMSRTTIKVDDLPGLEARRVLLARDLPHRRTAHRRAIDVLGRHVLRLAWRGGHRGPAQQVPVRRRLAGLLPDVPAARQSERRRSRRDGVVLPRGQHAVTRIFTLPPSRAPAWRP